MAKKMKSDPPELLPMLMPASMMAKVSGIRRGNSANLDGTGGNRIPADRQPPLTQRQCHLGLLRNP